VALGEIYLNHLALERSSNDQVRGFAKKAISDNMVMAERLRTIETQDAVLKGSTVDVQRSKPGLLASIEPAGLDMSQVSNRYKEMGEKLIKLTGSGFDREYLLMTIADHRMLVDDLKRAPSDTGYDVLPRDTAGRPTVRNSPTNIEPETAGEYRREADFAREMLPTVRQNLAEADRILASL
jgi:predicted outer membrane protein